MFDGAALGFSLSSHRSQSFMRQVSPQTRRIGEPYEA